jgi:hypothetical protein
MVTSPEEYQETSEVATDDNDEEEEVQRSGNGGEVEATLSRKTRG